ncbi:uncharacterized protein LOC143558775 [Bidens hawaiensis]|uniref:uncharacterized protein LOC143558775 n=1 Tax=Bidens hawaiensis TaxID=980011 RepID=UPI00404B7498
MYKRLLLRIAEDLEREFDYFKKKLDGRGMLGFTAIQKVTSAIRVLAYKNTTDINYEYLKMTDKTSRDTLEHLCYGIIKMYVARYLRTSNCNDLERIYEKHARVHGRTECPTYIPDDDPLPMQATLEQRLENMYFVRSKEIHNTLMADLVQHAWMFRCLPSENKVEDEGSNEDKDEFDDEDDGDGANEDEDEDDEGANEAE